MWDLLEHGLGRQPLLHQPRHDVLQKEPVKSAYHHDPVKHHEERGHSSAEPEAAVQNHERNREDREPDVSAQPALHRSHPPKWNLFSQTQERRENENRQRNRAEPETERRPADGMMLGRILD